MLTALLLDNDYNILLVEHQGKLARFGLTYMKILLEKSGKSCEFVNELDDSHDELMPDLVSSITYFSEKIIWSKNQEEKNGKTNRGITKCRSKAVVRVRR